MSNENNSANNADNNANDVDSANNNVDTNASNVNNVPTEVDSEAETEVFAKPAVPDNVYARTEDKSSTTNETTETATAKPEEPTEPEPEKPESKEKSQMPEQPKPEILLEANDASTKSNASNAYESTYHTSTGNVNTDADNVNTDVDTVNNDTVNNESNWPDFLVDHKNQQLFGLATITIGAFTGLIGAIFAAYYLFYLDDSEKKDNSAKLMSYVGLALPIISILIFLLFFFPVFFISLA